MTFSRHVTFVTGQLGQGGSERQLALLATALAKRGDRVSVACLSAEDEPYGPRLEAAGIEVALFARRGSWDPARAWRLRRWVRTRRPDAVCAFGDLATVYAVVACWALSDRPRVAGLIRRGRGNLPALKRLLVRLSLLGADALAANSETGRRYAIDTLGLPEHRLALLPNAVPPDVFEPGNDPARVRNELATPPGAPVVLYVGRNASAKDIPTLIRVLSRLEHATGPLHAWVAGPGLDCCPEGAEPPDRLTHWLGRRTDVPALLGAADVLLLTSKSEGTPNVILEALAQGCPVVTTDAGDAASLLGSEGAGVVTAVGDDAALAVGVLQVVAEGDRFRAAAARARERIRSEFSIEASVARLDALIGFADATGAGGGRR